MIKGIAQSPIAKKIVLGTMFMAAAGIGYSAKPNVNTSSEMRNEQLMSLNASQVLAMQGLPQRTSTFRKTKAFEESQISRVKELHKRPVLRAKADKQYLENGLPYMLMCLQASVLESRFDESSEWMYLNGGPKIARRLKKEGPTENEKYMYELQNSMGLIDLASIFGEDLTIEDYYTNKASKSVEEFKEFYKDTWVPQRNSYIEKALKAGKNRPTAAQCCYYMDKLIQSVSFLKDEDREYYNKMSKMFERYLSNTPENRARIATYKLNTIEELVAQRFLKGKYLGNYEETDYFIVGFRIMCTSYALPQCSDEKYM